MSTDEYHVSTATQYRVWQAWKPAGAKRAFRFMAIKKSDLYSSLWASCDELRGGMDASQYKDYVLFMLFIKYVSEKYGDSDDFAPPVTIPKGASFRDMIALKGDSDIGNKINMQVIAAHRRQFSPDPQRLSGLQRPQQTRRRV